MNPILERLYELMRERGTNAKRVCEELDMSNSAFTDWKNGKAKPGVVALSKLAEYFNVSLDFLILGKETAPNPDAPPVVVERVVYAGLDSSSPADNELCGKFHRLSPENQGKVMAYMDGMLAALPLQTSQNAQTVKDDAQSAGKPEHRPVSIEEAGQECAESALKSA